MWFGQLKKQTIYLVDVLDNGLLREVQQLGKYVHPDDRLVIGKVELAEQRHTEAQRHAEAQRRLREDRQHPIFSLFVLRPVRNRFGLFQTCGIWAVSASLAAVKCAQLMLRIALDIPSTPWQKWRSCSDWTSAYSQRDCLVSFQEVCV